MLRGDHSVSERCQRSLRKVTVITNNPKYSIVWYGIDLSIPSLYCGAKYCKAGLKK